MENKYENNAKVFKALCDPNRLLILELLQNGEACACSILDVLKIGQSTLSHHMKILCESGMVSSRRDAKWTYYALDTIGCEYTKNLLNEILTYSADTVNQTSCPCD